MPLWADAPVNSVLTACGLAACGSVGFLQEPGPAHTHTTHALTDFTSLAYREFLHKRPEPSINTKLWADLAFLDWPREPCE